MTVTNKQTVSNALSEKETILLQLEAKQARLKEEWDQFKAEAAGIDDLIRAAARAANIAEVVRLKNRQSELRTLVPMAELAVHLSGIELADAGEAFRLERRAWLQSEVERLGKGTGYVEGLDAYTRALRAYEGTEATGSTFRMNAAKRVSELVEQLVKL